MSQVNIYLVKMRGSLMISLYQMRENVINDDEHSCPHLLTVSDTDGISVLSLYTGGQEEQR